MQYLVNGKEKKPHVQLDIKTFERLLTKREIARSVRLSNEAQS